MQTGFSPMAKTLIDSVLHDLLPGDFIVVSFPTGAPIRFHLAAAGHESTQVDVDRILPQGVRKKIYQINGTRPTTSGRFFLFVDQAYYEALLALPRRRAMSLSFLNDKTVQSYLEENGYDYQIVVDIPGGKVYRFESPLCDYMAYNRTLSVTGERQKLCLKISGAARR